MATKNGRQRSLEEAARREKIRELLETAGVSGMEDIQQLFRGTIKCPRNILAILPQLLLVISLHELSDIGKQFFLRLRDPALDMEKIRSVLIHEDRNSDR